MAIIFKENFHLKTSDIIELFNSSGINRPCQDKNRIKKMFNNSNLIISAWHNDLLVGIGRALTDFSYCCYLSDLAVRKEYQKKGIGKKIIELTKKRIGKKSMLLLLSAPNAMKYYRKLNFEKVKNGFILKRLK